MIKMATEKEAALTVKEAFSVGLISSVPKHSGAFTILMVYATLDIKFSAPRSRMVTFVVRVAGLSLATILELSSRSAPL